MSWWDQMGKNLQIAKAFASRAMVTKTAASYGRWMTVGAGLGAIRGMADNMYGEDRVSVLGGMIHGAMLGGAARGMGSLWGMRGRLGKGAGESIIPEYVGQRAIPGRSRLALPAPNRGFIMGAGRGPTYTGLSRPSPLALPGPTMGRRGRKTV